MGKIKIKDSRAITIVQPSVELTLEQDNVKTLEDADAGIHLAMLGKALYQLSQLVEDRLPDIGEGHRKDLQQYVARLSNTLEAIVLKNRIEAQQPNSDVRFSYAIDPTNSGFPIFLRDVRFLESDWRGAKERVAQLPPDQQLVDAALYALFRSCYPKETILQKLQRDYCEKLSSLELPVPLRIHPVVHVGDEGNNPLCTCSVERLDEHHNIPRLYTIAIQFTSPDIFKEEKAWRQSLDSAIAQGFSAVASMELPYLAKCIEDLDGIQLLRVERFDVGPFYDRFTSNPEPVQYLLDAGTEQDSILFFRHSSVQRVGEQERKGWKNRIIGWVSGDRHAGIFSPAIASPQYLLMPHRLIQKVHAVGLELGGPVKMYGTTSGGDIVD